MNSSCLFLEKLDVFEIFQIFVTVVITAHVFLYLLSNFFFDLGMTSNFINHHLSIIRCSVSSSNKECIKFFKDFLFIRNKFLMIIFFLLIIMSIHNECFNDIIRNFFFRMFLNILFNFTDSLFNKLMAPLFINNHSILELSVFFC